jgi:hypothetical protein
MTYAIGAIAHHNNLQPCKSKKAMEGDRAQNNLQPCKSPYKGW